MSGMWIGYMLSVGVSSTRLNERGVLRVFINLMGNYWIIVLQVI